MSHQTSRSQETGGSRQQAAGRRGDAGKRRDGDYGAWSMVHGAWDYAVGGWRSAQSGGPRFRLEAIDVFFLYLSFLPQTSNLKHQV